MFDTLIHRLEELAARQPDKPAVEFKKDLLTYAQLVEAVRKTGVILRELGVRRGDRVLFTALSKPEMPVIYLGIQYCGGVAVFIDKNATPENAADIYEDTDAVLFLTDKPMKGKEEACRLHSLKEVYAEARTQEMSPERLASCPYQLPDPEAPAEMIFTTGTTGKPKGVTLSYRAVSNISRNNVEGVGFGQDDRELIPLPLNHSLGLRVMRSMLSVGGTVVLQNGFTFAKELETNILEKHCTGMVTVPASMELTRTQMQEKFAQVIGTLRYIEVGAGSLSTRQKQMYAQMLPDTRIVNTWGSSETGGAIFLRVNEVAADPVKITAIGKPLPWVQVQTLDEEGSSIKADHDNPGRLALSGGMVMSGYWNRPEETADALRDGWLVTNDLVYFDEDGFVYMLGRADDIINVGGEKVSPIELENIASQFKSIKECACIGVPDPNEVLGQVPALFLAVESGGYNKEELLQFLAARMERYKLPQEFVEVEALPRNRMKKIDRRAMRQMWKERTERQEEGLKTDNPVIQAMLTRHSIRKFTGQPVERELLEVITKAGMHAPSGHNMQTWQFTVVTNQEKIARLKAAAEESAKAENVYCYGFNNPACLILVSNNNKNHNGCQDASCAAENMLLAAHSLGLGAVWLNVLRTLRDSEPVKSVLDEFGVPENHTVWSTVALGWPAEEGKALAKKESVVRYVD